MKDDSNKKRIKFNRVIIAIVIVAIVLCLLFSVFKLLKNPTNTFIVSNGEISKEETVIGYIARDETIVEGESHKGKITKIKNEGERVAKNDAVFRYASQNEEELQSKISELDNQIQDLIKNEDNTFSTDKKLLENQIENELNLLYQNNEVQKIQEYKKTINSYITKRAQIVGNLSKSGSYLKKLIDERTGYENQLDSEAEYVKAPISGIVSYKIDNMENVINLSDINNLKNLNKKFLESLNLKTGQMIGNSDTKGKIINNYNSYIIFNSNSEESKNAKVNDNLSIRIQDGSTITAKIKNIVEESDGSRTIAIYIEKEVEKLIEYRKISFDIIWWQASGYRVPNTAIKEINGVNYVLRIRNGYTDKMAVKVLKQDEEYSIVKDCPRSELLNAGLTSSEISDLKTITLYDEIVLKPNI